MTYREHWCTETGYDLIPSQVEPTVYGLLDQPDDAIREAFKDYDNPQGARDDPSELWCKLQG